MRVTTEELLKVWLGEGQRNFNKTGRILGVDEATCRRRINRMYDKTKNPDFLSGRVRVDEVLEKQKEPLEKPEALVYFPDRKDAPLDWESVLERHGELAARRDAEDPKQLRARIDLGRHAGPVAIFQMSDVHIGSPQCDTRTLIRHIKLLKTTPNLYCILDGDVTEWAISPKMLDAVLGQVGSPQEQVRVLQAMLEDLSSKVIAFVTGNHDERGVRMGGVDVFEFIMQRVAERGVYLRDGGVLRIALAGVEYSWRVSHGDGLRGNSMYSNTSALTRNARHEMGFTDIASAGHTHDPEIKIIYEPRDGGAAKEPSIYIRSGSYKVLYGENYVDRQGFNPIPTVTMPAVVLWPGEKRMVPFFTVEEAVAYLQALEGPAVDSKSGSVRSNPPARSSAKAGPSR